MINKKVLSEIAIYQGKVKMPKGFEIEKDELVKNILLSKYYENLNYSFSISWDKLKTFIIDFMTTEYDMSLVPHVNYGNFYERGETSKPKLEINLMDLKNSHDFVLLYGVEIDPNTCKIIINYDDNKRKGKRFEYNLNNDDFIMFPTSQLYYVENNKNSYLNFIQTIIFDKLN
jgi:hypothetical protein